MWGSHNSIEYGTGTQESVGELQRDQGGGEGCLHCCICWGSGKVLLVSVLPHCLVCRVHCPPSLEHTPSASHTTFWIWATVCDPITRGIRPTLLLPVGYGLRSWKQEWAKPSTKLHSFKGVLSPIFCYPALCFHSRLAKMVAFSVV